MNSRFPHLFRPIKIGSLIFKNRIVSAPTSCAELSPESYLTRDNIAYYKLKAQGGAACVTVGESIVHPTGRSHPKQILLYDEGIIPSLVETADAIHQYGAIASVELSHGGMECDPVFLGGRNPVGPSATSTEIGFRTTGANRVIVEEMTEELMDEIADSYALGAARVKLAGFDMCMIHAAHGWLLAQFFSPLTNFRKDKFGGSVQNRARFPMMIIERIREKIGKDFPIELRISGSELTEGGLTIEDAVEICRMAEQKVDLIHVSAGAHSIIRTMTVMHPSMFLQHGCNVYLAEAVKKAVNVPVATVGGITDPKQMEEIIAGNKADIIAVARGLIADPYLPRKAKNGKDDDVVHCLRCFDCIGGMHKTRTMKCAVNPAIGREFESSIPVKATERKKIVIIGGGPAGMQAAITADERGHDVILCEQSSSLGGTLGLVTRGVPFKKDMNRFIEYQMRKVNTSGINVILNTEATPEFIAQEKPDILIVAVGAEPVIPSIPGTDGKSVIMATSVYYGETKIGKRVVIVGGGLVGCETGLHLAQKGNDVTIVELLDDIAPDANIMHKWALMIEMEKYVKVSAGTKCTAITDRGVKAIDGNGKEILFDADTVIIAVGMRPRSDIVDTLRDLAPECIAIGDCVKPGHILQAVRTGYDAAMSV